MSKYTVCFSLNSTIDVDAKHHDDAYEIAEKKLVEQYVAKINELLGKEVTIEVFEAEEQ